MNTEQQKIILGFGDVVEFPTGTAEDGTRLWGDKSIVTATRNAREFSAARLQRTEAGLERLPTSGTEYPPMRKVNEEPWDLERVALAVQRGVGTLALDTIILIYTEAADLPPVEYIFDTPTNPLRRPD
ncbi:MAG TPA: hypothetical protein VLF43_04305 [Candidatus Saccharimonadales bacterium]|nr:hypothetical protein [Candidatus Saccharimonadales bacterium]